MTRDDVRKTFPEATDEQIKGLLDIHSADIGKAKGASQSALDRVADLETALATAQSTITNLETHKTDVASLQAEVELYKQSEKDRNEAQEKQKALKALESRFNATTGDRTFVHDYVRQGVMSEFEKALQDETNQGKADKEIFEAITKDKDYFASMNPSPQSMGTIGQDQTTTDRARAIMGLSAK